MSPTINRKPTRKLIVDNAVFAFEAAWAAEGRADCRALLPPKDDPDYLLVLSELLRIDIEFKWRNGQQVRLWDYREEFPELFADLALLQTVAFEEFRQRREMGEYPIPAEYRLMYGIETPNWVEDESGDEEDFRHHRAEVKGLGAWFDSLARPGSSDFLRSLRHDDPEVGRRLVDALARLPQVGETFHGFRLLDELGRGAFGRVYLAEQPDLAGRQVVLKIAADIFGESQTLARLQHTHIMPIFSVHRFDAFQAVCMPYFGATTLADVIAQLLKSQCLPTSGRMLASTVHDRKQLTRRSTAAEHEGASVELPDLDVDSEEAEPDFGMLQFFAKQTYVQSITWLASRLADGLAYAHEHGVLHRDLKPANVLLTDDGHPMLLDFNLARDAQRRDIGSCIGGTLPYMAPEHLQAYYGETTIVDARSDIYALGVVVFELLTGHHPKPAASEDPKEILTQAMQPAPSARALNPAVSHGLDAIVKRLLDPDPAGRYQSARMLHEDLERHRHNLALRHTPEPSLMERTAKWVRRHPRSTASGTISFFAILLLAGLASAWATQRGRAAELTALRKIDDLRAGLRTGQSILYRSNPEPEEVKRAAAACRESLGLLGVEESPDWRKQKSLSKLTAEQWNALEADIGELFYLLAQAELQLARSIPDRQARQAATESAARRAELAGNPAASEETGVRALYLKGHELSKAQRFGEALGLLEVATQRDPQCFAAWCVRGNCHFALSQSADALACFTAALTLRPEDYIPWFNRGLVRLRQQNWHLAKSDFTRVIDLRPDLADAFLNRAVALEGLGDKDGAAADLTKCLECGISRTRVYFFRARIRAALGDAAGAEKDIMEGLHREPQDVASWVSRALVRADRGDGAGSLHDLDCALAIDPNSLTALQNRANILAETLNRPAQAVLDLNRILAIAPDNGAARAGRGILLARMNQNDDARLDAEAALRVSRDASNLYQVAGIFALTSRVYPEDRQRAVQLLATALRTGFGLDLIDKDHDLDPIRPSEEFKAVVSAARALHNHKLY